jgi:hypothetical protein
MFACICVFVCVCEALVLISVVEIVQTTRFPVTTQYLQYPCYMSSVLSFFPVEIYVSVTCITCYKAPAFRIVILYSRFEAFNQFLSFMFHSMFRIGFSRITEGRFSVYRYQSVTVQSA